MGVVTEEVEEIWACCTTAELRERKYGLVELAERVWTLANQEAIAILVGSGMEMLSGRGRSHECQRAGVEAQSTPQSHPHGVYSVKHLKRLPSGEDWFDPAMAFNPKDQTKVNRVFAEVLGKSPATRKTVQAKFYLTPDTYERLRKRAATRGVAQSVLVEVEEALQSTLNLSEAS